MGDRRWEIEDRRWEMYRCADVQMCKCADWKMKDKDTSWEMETDEDFNSFKEW